LESWGDIWRTVFGRLTGRLANFWWLEEGRVAGGSRPTSLRELRWVEGMGIKTLIGLSLTRVPEEWVGRLGLEYHHFPIKNHEAPSPGLVRRVASIIDASLGEGRPVLVHCSAGRGRTGCVLAAWLMLSRGLEAPEAIGRVRLREPGAIERRQEEFLRGLQP